VARPHALLALAALVAACSSGQTNGRGEASPGAKLVERVVAAHGASKLGEASVDFVFRGTPYRMTRSGGRYRYERWPSPRQHEVLTNDGYRFLVDGQPAKLSRAMLAARARDLNSVVYFASLPYPLLDEAVRPRPVGRQTVGGVEHDVLEIRFAEAGGGEDHDDVFRYWLDPATGQMRHLAYSFARSGGGVRFRVATSTEASGGVVFVNWANFGVDDPEVPLESLPGRWAQGDLPELSDIELGGVQVTEPRFDGNRRAPRR
jgi:hypothetical protein